MNMKKTLIAMLLGAFVIAGVAVPYVTQAAQTERGPGAMSQQLATDFGLNKADVEKYMQQRVNPQDLMHAAMLAKASGKPLKDVMEMKTLANTWKDVEQSLGVTREQLQTMRQDMMATRMEKNLNIPKQNTIALLKQGYHPRDIEVAGLLAQNTKKPVAEVLAMKQINNSWQDVAKQLGVNDDTFKKDMSKIHDVMPGARHHHGGHGGMMGGMDRPCEGK